MTKRLGKGTLARACYLAIGAARKPLTSHEVAAILDLAGIVHGGQGSIRSTLWANKAFSRYKGSLASSMYGLAEWRVLMGDDHEFEPTDACAVCGRGVALHK